MGGRPGRTDDAPQIAVSTASAASAASAGSAVEETVAQVAALLRSRGERMTAPRRAVLAVLAGRDEHLSAETVYQEVAARDADVHRASVYRTLDALSTLGVVQHVHVSRGGTAYHLIREGDRHLHAQCRLCGAVYDLPPDLLDDVAAAVARLYDFDLDAGHVALSGVCHRCTTP